MKQKEELMKTKVWDWAEVFSQIKSGTSKKLNLFSHHKMHAGEIQVGFNFSHSGGKAFLCPCSVSVSLCYSSLSDLCI